MISAYLGSAAVSAIVHLALNGKSPKKRIIIEVCIFMILCAAFTVWFVQTGGNYGIAGRNGITLDWATE